jgi:hypothetical protein
MVEQIPSTGTIKPNIRYPVLRYRFAGSALHRQNRNHIRVLKYFLEML